MITSLDDLQARGALSPLDVRFAKTMARIAGEPNELVHLAAAATSRFTLQGHVCLDLGHLGGQAVETAEGDRLGELTWPGRDEWVAALGESPLVDQGPAFSQHRPLILDQGARLYLTRYWRYQDRLAEALVRRARAPVAGIDEDLLRAGLQRLFGQPHQVKPDLQRLAAALAVLKHLAVISGGPGTGKTSTVVRILVLLLEQARVMGKTLRVQMVAPTGKAAARLAESVESAFSAQNPVSIHCDPEIRAALPASASTIHRALGTRFDSATRFRRTADDPLPVDVLVVDEASMVDLALMAKLVDAVPEEAHLILLGDKDQLASVEAGAILGELCGSDDQPGLSTDLATRLSSLTGQELPKGGQDKVRSFIQDSIVHLTHSYRFEAHTGIGRLAAAIKAGDVPEVLAVLDDRSAPEVELVEPVGSGVPEQDLNPLIKDGYSELFAPADPAGHLKSLNRFRVLCAHRAGRFGVININRTIESILARRFRLPTHKIWYPGKPIMVTRNDPGLGLFNGDVGVVLPAPDGLLRAFFPAEQGQLRSFSPSRLPAWEPVYATTVHKGQGSEFDRVLLVLPGRVSPVTTRELLYTAVTRARKSLTIIAPREVVQGAVESRVVRSSGLRAALWGESESGSPL